MKYVDFIKEKLEVAFGRSFTITEDAQFGDNDVNVLVNSLRGTNFGHSLVQPIQIIAYGYDMDLLKQGLEVFSNENTNTTITIGQDYIVQTYTSPMVIGKFMQSADNYKFQVVIDGTLIISRNIDDIKKVYIDGDEVFTIDRKVIYTTSISNKRTNEQQNNITKITSATIQVVLQVLAKNSVLNHKLREIRKGNLNFNNDFVIKLEYIDESIEEYTMKCESQAFNSTNQTLPTLELAFRV